MKFTLDTIQRIAKDNYDLECTIRPLAGDVDFNFLLEAENNSKYLLKICKPEVSQQEIQFQIELLNYLKGKEISFDIPQMIPTKSQETSFIYQYEDSDYAVRMHTWIDGRMLADVNPRSSELTQ